MKKQGYIYRIYHKDTGKSYIGLHYGVKWDTRVKSHLSGNSSNSILKRSVLKYGPDAFGAECLRAGLNEKELPIVEGHLILQYDTMTPNGYNLTTGGETFRLTKETKQKISEAMTEEIRQKISKTHSGKIVSKETRRKISEGHIGRKASIETKQKMSEWHTGKVVSEKTGRKLSKLNIGKNNPFHNKTHTPESLESISNSLKEYYRNNKPVRRRLTKEQIAKIYELREEGYSYKKIAKMVSCSPAAARNIWLKRCKNESRNFNQGSNS